jgi:hypothetical protein
MRVKQNTENTPVPIRVYFKFTESCVPYDYLPRSKYHDLDHGRINLYCNLGAHEYLDLDPGVVNGLTSNTKSVKTSKILSYKYLPSKNFTDYTTALHRVVSYPKLIKLGSTGSSTKRCGAVKKFKYTKNSKFPKNSQKIKKKIKF